MTSKNIVSIKNVSLIIKKKVKKFGTGAQVICPKELLGKEVYLILQESKSEKKN
jgi:putative transposon-encoded protein